MNPDVDLPEGTFTAAGTDSLAPRFATTHIATTWVQPPRPPWWRRLLEWLGLSA